MWSPGTSSLCTLGWKPSLALMAILGFLMMAELTSSSPAHPALNLENMSSAELEELANQLAAQELEASSHQSTQHQPDLAGSSLFSASAGSLGTSSSSHALNTAHTVISECVTISMDEGVFHYKSRGTGDQVCGLYLVADPDKTIVISLHYLDVDCHRRGLISIVDGWELNGEVFPSVEDHEKSFASRFHEMCGLEMTGSEQTFVSSQNAALIQYRIPVSGQGFSIRVQHVHNPRPCNILVQDTEGAYTLENYGRHVNCTLTTLFDAKVRILYMSTGQHVSPTQCGKMGLEDYVQIGGSSGLDSSKMQVVDEFCGHSPMPNLRRTTIFCGMTTVRLVSSGKYHNKVTVEVRKADFDDIPSANYVCGV
ncbi:unnamed protein product [Allacma fusca]|uniref:Corticotropin-releasing factor-binding protein n=1 Tax=Allacma fusca TaxID=39272 RepID=A0A8J2PLJ0_9HEXA|nr:unnamed protein product [Allacma fusca]